MMLHRSRRFRHGGRVPQRSGVALLAVMICLIVVALLVPTWLKTLAAERQQVRSAEAHLQADWLVQAALERAVAGLSLKADYAGEKWEIPATELSGTKSAVIQIRVASVADGNQRHSIEVTVDYLPEAAGAIHVEKKVTVAAAPETTASRAESTKQSNRTKGR